MIKRNLAGTGLPTCCNGCPAQVQYPSKVLCAECFARLDAKFRALWESLAKRGAAVARPGDARR